MPVCQSFENWITQQEKGHLRMLALKRQQEYDMLMEFGPEWDEADWNDDGCTYCPHCGSQYVEFTGEKIKGWFIFQCGDCGEFSGFPDVMDPDLDQRLAT